MRLLTTSLKLIVITFLFIILKIILQFFWGTIFESSPYPYNSLSIFNINNFFHDGFSFSNIILIVFYEFVLFFCAYYIWVFILLFFITTKMKRNSIVIHILYLLCVYFIACFIFNEQKIEFIGIVTTMILSIFNWSLFNRLLFYQSEKRMKTDENN